MVDRILTWYVENQTGDGTFQGPVHTLDTSYAFPAELRAYAAVAPGRDMQVDIKYKKYSETSWTTIFTDYPTIQKGLNNLDEWDDFVTSLTVLPKFTVLRLDFISNGGAKGVTVQLELNKDYEEERVEKTE